MSDVFIHNTDPQTLFQNIDEKLQSGEISAMQGIVLLQGLLRSLTDHTTDELRLMAIVAHKIGVLYTITGDIKASNQYYELTRGYFERLDRPVAVLHTDLNIALNLVRYGRYEQLIALFQSIDERGAALTDTRRYVVIAYAQLYGIACRIKQGNFAPDAMIKVVLGLQGTLDKNAETIDTENFNRLYAETYITLVDLCIRKNDFAAAHQAITAAHPYTQSDHILVGMLQQSYGEFIAFFPDTELGNDSNKYYEAARQAFQKEKIYEYIGHAFFSQGYSAAKCGQNHHARYFFRQAIAYYAGRDVAFRLQQAQRAINVLAEDGQLDMPKPFFVGE